MKALSAGRLVITRDSDMSMAINFSASWTKMGELLEVDRLRARGL